MQLFSANILLDFNRVVNNTVPAAGGFDCLLRQFRRLLFLSNKNKYGKRRSLDWHCVILRKKWIYRRRNCTLTASIKWNCHIAHSHYPYCAYSPAQLPTPGLLIAPVNNSVLSMFLSLIGWWRLLIITSGSSSTKVKFCKHNKPEAHGE